MVLKIWVTSWFNTYWHQAITNADRETFGFTSKFSFNGCVVGSADKLQPNWIFDMSDFFQASDIKLTVAK